VDLTEDGAPSLAIGVGSGVEGNGTGPVVNLAKTAGGGGDLSREDISSSTSNCAIGY